MVPENDIWSMNLSLSMKQSIYLPVGDGKGLFILSPSGILIFNGEYIIFEFSTELIEFLLCPV